MNRREFEATAFFFGAIPVGMVLNGVMDSSSHGLFFVIVTIAACGFTCEYIVRQFFNIRDARRRQKRVARIRERLNRSEGNSGDTISPGTATAD